MKVSSTRIFTEIKKNGAHSFTSLFKVHIGFDAFTDDPIYIREDKDGRLQQLNVEEFFELEKKSTI